MSLRSLRQHRQAWQAILDYYIFNHDETTVKHAAAAKASEVRNPYDKPPGAKG
ncbi:MAG: hypothetical protein U5L01_07760 [Rheinheimera sp.]|nr:hypothetical protein [Rheinheimera sp.]